jgi:conjugative transfer signal peptidase TraF
MVLLALGSIALAYPQPHVPVLLWNASPSVATGLYRLTLQPPPTGTLAVIRLPEPFRTLADSRSYLRAGALLIKPVAAGAGDTVCRHGPLVTINGRVVARAKTADQAGRLLPVWSSCFRLAPTQIFVLSEKPDSFDSRYFGPVESRHIVGMAVPIWVRTPT